MNIKLFSQTDFISALKALFNDLGVPMNQVTDEPTSAKEILKDTYKDNETFQLIGDVYFVGMVDDNAFEGNQSLNPKEIKSDYEGILIFGVSLKSRTNDLLPTRSQLAEISRAFNREFYYTPVVIVFKYDKYLAFSSTERLQYKQEWREGEKAGKVSLLRDIDIYQPHRGHTDILNQLKIQTKGVNAVNSFESLYVYWQKVFSVSLLSKKFYQELSNWYFWAIKHVVFPGQPSIEDAHAKGVNIDELIQEHKATNVIRMLTRLLFVWFVKEKKLIPEELFDLDTLQKDILNEISPHIDNGLFSQANRESVYYKAILQNLFFASLNCPIKPDDTDGRERGFRGDGYGKHRGVDYLMRYKKYFKNPDAFLKMMNEAVPFLNGGLFECLDDKFKNLYIDGFSDQMTKGEQLVVPDFLFFGANDEEDLSAEYGIDSSYTKRVAVKGLINILKSYKFTITENTPIEEDVALDPELLGKVFENLLASYNPETKTTARKQTGSFYTPREIVNYMVDESLIAYLKNKLSSFKGGVPAGGGGNIKSLTPEGESDNIYPPTPEGKKPSINNLPHLKTFRKELRNNSTPAEAKLWTMLKGRQLDGRKFRRQFSVGNYILDFYCHEEKIAIELDGQGHFEASQAEYDAERDLFLAHTGIKVLRFENKWVWDNPEGLLNEVRANFGWLDPSVLRTAPLGGEQPKRGASTAGQTWEMKNSGEQIIGMVNTEELSWEEYLDKELHILTSFDSKVPFSDSPELQKEIITALSTCTILDPACGSGAFPMGVLQKMVHILQKLDPSNEIWKEVQLEKALKESEKAFKIDDKQARSERLEEINNAFDQNINNPDYARKLFLIENCIYGVDIQPIAVQISKLRFFISLVTEQKVNTKKENFGILPLPNLETKIVAANTLIGIEKENNLFSTDEIRELEQELKDVRSKLFTAKTKDTKLKYRELDKKLRQEIAEKLTQQGFPHHDAEKLATWDPYNQNMSSSFFDPEWMFDIKEGFDVVIGNPPYVDLKALPNEVVRYIFKNFKSALNRVNLYSTFIEKGVELLNDEGILSYINPNSILVNESYEKLRKILLPGVEKIIKLPDSVFENATVETIILITRIVSKKPFIEGSFFSNDSIINFETIQFKLFSRNDWKQSEGMKFNIFVNDQIDNILKEVEDKGELLSKYFETSLGITPYDKYRGHSQELIKNRKFHAPIKKSESYVPLISGKNLSRYFVDNNYSEFLNYGPWLGAPREERFFTEEKIIVRQIVGGNDLRLVASYSNEPHYFTQIGFSLILKIKNSKLLKATIAILNSSLLSFYHKHKFLDIEKIVFQKVLIANCKKLPLRLNYIDNILCFLVNIILFQGKDSDFIITFDSVIDALVFNLYFPDHMRERGIDVLEFVEQDIAEVMQGREFENLSDTEKEQVIEQLHTRWSNPNNEVVKRMAMFKEKSPEILKPILET